MSKATFTFGRFNPPTEAGHGKLVKSVQQHAEKTGGAHYIFPSHSQDKKKNPLSHSDKVGAMRQLFPKANVVSHAKVRTAIDAMKHLESKGHTHVTMVVGSDRVGEFKGLLTKYRSKEFPKVKKVDVISAGHRDPDAEGAEGMSASKLRGLVSAGKKNEFVSHYSDKKLGAHIHDRVKAGMQMESTNPVGIFLLGGPGSGKDYVLKNIFSRFDLVEVQADQILNGAAAELFESNQNIVINGANDADKIELVQNILEGYTFDFVHVSVTNKVSRLRNEQREQPLSESKRIEKYLKAEQLAKDVEAFIFNNSINLNESSEFEKVFFASQIEKLLERVVELGLNLTNKAELKTFTAINEKVNMPAKYKTGNPKTDAARLSHWKKMSKYSDRDPRAYKDAPGDKKARKEGIPLSPHTVAVRKMMNKEEVEKGHVERRIAKGGNITAVKERQKENKQTEVSEGADSSLAAKAKKSGVSLGTLKKVFRRGVAAWNSGHRPGTTPQQWGHARVNSYINKGKTYHTADKDLREEEQIDEMDKSQPSSSRGAEGLALGKKANPVKSDKVKSDTLKILQKQYKKIKEEADINELFEMQLVGTDEYRKHAIAMTPGQGEPVDAFPVKSPNKKPVAVPAKPGKSIVSQYTEEQHDCGCEGDCGCDDVSEVREGSDETIFKDFRKLRTEAKKKESTVDTTPQLHPKKAKLSLINPKAYDSTLQGLPVTARFNALESVSLEEAVQYHLENKISFTENAFRPGSDMFFQMIDEAKKLYSEGKYEPKDEWEKDMLASNIGEKAIYEGQEVILDYPFEELDEACWDGYKQVGMKKKGDKMVPNCVKEETINEEDKTEGKGIGKPWREGGGGAVYVRDGGSIRKIRFSQSGMKKKYMDPAATRSFVARHRCLTNKDKTSASYWACRWPRFFSNSGKTWW